MIDTTTSRALRTRELQFEWNYVTVNSVSSTANDRLNPQWLCIRIFFTNLLASIHCIVLNIYICCDSQATCDRWRCHSVYFSICLFKKVAVKNKGDMIGSSPAWCSCDESSSNAEEKCVSCSRYRSSSFSAQICPVECEGMPEPLSPLLLVFARPRAWVCQREWAPRQTGWNVSLWLYPF